MKKKLISAIILSFLVSLVLSYGNWDGSSSTKSYFAEKSLTYLQTVKKPDYDYMDAVLSRNTQPLGLKENPGLRKFLNQSTIKWTIRSEQKHIFN